MRVFGTVDAVDATAETMTICEAEFVAQVDGPAPIESDACVQVFATGASHFDTDGLAISFDDIVAAFNTTGSLKVTAIGLAALPADDAPENIALELDAVVDELGPRRDDTMAGWETTTGTVTSDPFTTGCASSQCVDFLAGGAAADITVQLQTESRVFARDGTGLAQSDLTASLIGTFDGLRVDNGGTEELRASLFVVGPDAGETTVSGVLTGVSLGNGLGTLNDFDILMTVTPPDVGDPVAVCVSADTDVLQILTDGAGVTIADLLDPAVLDPSAGLLVEAAGISGDGLDCDIDADVVIVEDPAQSVSP